MPDRLGKGVLVDRRGTVEEDEAGDDAGERDPELEDVEHRVATAKRLLQPVDRLWSRL